MTNRKIEYTDCMLGSIYKPKMSYLVIHVGLKVASTVDKIHNPRYVFHTFFAMLAQTRYESSKKTFNVGNVQICILLEVLRTTHITL